MLNQTIDLYLDKFSMPPVVHMVQNDTGRKLHMYTVDMELGGGETAELSIHRPDDSYYTVSCYVNGMEYYEADVTQALTRPGKVECQLKVTKATKIMSTFTFYNMVQEAVDGVPVEQLGPNVYDLLEAVDGLPIPVRYGFDMTDENVVYLYIGTEGRYTQGHLYYWNGSAWTDGGAYGGGGGSSITVDSALSSTSENPVQNKVIYTALQSKANSSDVPSTAADVGAIAAPSSPASGAFLVYNGTAWVAQTLSTWSATTY